MLLGKRSLGLGGALFTTVLLACGDDRQPPTRPRVDHADHADHPELRPEHGHRHRREPDDLRRQQQQQQRHQHRRRPPASPPPAPDTSVGEVSTAVDDTTQGKQLGLVRRGRDQVRRRARPVGHDGRAAAADGLVSPVRDPWRVRRLPQVHRPRLRAVPRQEDRDRHDQPAGGAVQPRPAHHRHRRPAAAAGPQLRRAQVPQPELDGGEPRQELRPHARLGRQHLPRRDHRLLQRARRRTRSTRSTRSPARSPTSRPCPTTAPRSATSTTTASARRSTSATTRTAASTSST
jgi:hypothetical protein